MTTLFRNSAGTDLDDVFDPYVEGTKPGATAYRTSDGTDLNQRYAPLAYGSQAAATGFRLSNGSDVNTLWAAKGTAAYAQPPPFGQYECDSTGTHNTGVGFDLYWNADGTWSIVLTAAPGGAGGNGGMKSGAPLNGTWLTSGSASDYEVRVTPNVMLSGIGNERYTAGTSGWVSAASNLRFTASMGNYANGGSETGSATTNGSYTVELRRVGSSVVRSSTADFVLSVG